jgi:hypothetical protein
MPPVRTLLSIPAFLIAVIGLAGCYDLSDPSGPHRDDFVRSRDATENAEQDQSQASTASRPDTAKALVLDEDVAVDRGATEAKPAVRVVPADAD